MATSRKIKQEESEASTQTLSNIPPRSRIKQRRSWSAAVLSSGTRLAVWYAIITALFFCPSSLDQLSSDASPVCRPYLHARNYASPYLVPYYDTYAAPYVHAVRPYADRFNTAVYQPGSKYARAGYDRYGAPRVAQAQRYGQDEWQRVVKPQIDNAQALVQKQYDASLSPYVKQAQDTVSPYYATARDSALHQYHTTLLPTYNAAAPYATWAYGRAHVFATDVGLPYLQRGGEVAYNVLSRRIWPPIRILYGQSVQPQLIKIRERLSNYRDGKAIESAMDQALREATQAEASTLSSASSSSSSSTASVISASGTATSEDQKTTDPPVKQSLGSELKAWKARFAKASDKGTQELKDHVSEIATSQIESQAQGTGQALITGLEETASDAIAKLKRRIITIVNAIPDEETDEDEAKAVEASHDEIRASGKKIKAAAQRLRAWKTSYIENTENLVRDATENTLDVIDHIRELGLQEIGMRYAHEEDATHKEWKQYHALKKTFDTWRDAIENAGLKHDSLAKAKQIGEDVEAQGMAVAEDAAKELARLKNVALWKIRTKDASDDFGTKVVPAAAIRAQQFVVEQIRDASEAIVGTTQGTLESLTSAAAASASSLVEAASSAADPAADALSATASSVADAVTSVAAPVADAISSNVSSASDVISSAAAPAVDAVSSGVSSASDVISSAAAPVVDAASSKSSLGAEAASSVAASVADAAPSSASSVRSVAASIVPDQASSIAGSIISGGSAASKAVSSASSSAKSQGSDAIDVAQAGVSSASRQVSSAAAPSSISSVAEQVVSAASESASSLSSSVKSRAGSAADQVASAASKSAPSASSSVKSRASIASSRASKDVSSSLSSASGRIDPVASALSSATSDFVKAPAESASSSIASIVSAAGEKYTDVTSSLSSSASSAASRASLSVESI